MALQNAFPVDQENGERDFSSLLPVDTNAPDNRGREGRLEQPD